MKIAASAMNAPGVEPLSVPRSRAVDYLELTKPRIGVMVLVTVAVGAILASGGALDWWLLMNVLLGTALVAAGGSSLNQVIERHTDGRMRRTENRPLPAGRIRPMEAVTFGIVLGAGGVAYLALTLPHISAALVAALSFVGYVFVYTPLKRCTTLNTLIGAVPGALPPLIGWTAVCGTIDPAAAVLFAILFLWQVPHFLAIAWIYREDYHRAGLRMLPSEEGCASMVGRQMVMYCLTLLAISLLPVGLLGAGPLYVTGAVVLGIFFLVCAIGFVQAPSVLQARRLLRASLVYLPALLVLLLVSTSWSRVQSPDTNASRSVLDPQASTLDRAAQARDHRPETRD